MTGMWFFIKEKWPILMLLLTSLALYAIVAYVLAHFIIRFW